MTAIPVKGIVVGVLIAAAIAAISFVGYWILAIWAATGIERGLAGPPDTPHSRAIERGYAARTPQWASTGQGIVINAGDGIYGVSTAGGELWRIPENPDDGLYFSPALSANDQAAYIRYLDGRDRRIERAELNGSKVKRLANLRGPTFYGGPVSRPSWSPDGTRIAFATTDGKITIMKSNGSHQHLTGCCYANGRPVSMSWSNDGRYLAILYDRHTIITTNADSGHEYIIAQVTDVESRLSILEWAPNDAIV